MQQESVIQKVKRIIEKGIVEKSIRKKLFVWAILIGSLVVTGVSFAWYSRMGKEAESDELNIMKPYYLTLMNPSMTDAMQLSVGSLTYGKTKQIVFCVTNKTDMEIAEFDYSLELIHTDNLALNYTIYALEAADADSAGIVAEDIVLESDTSTQVLTYWNVKDLSHPLVGVDVSDERHTQTALTGNEINSGTYIAYESDENNTLHLNVIPDGYDAQYFLLKIEWDESAQDNFANYENETDMIYLVAKAIQPQPQKKDETQTTVDDGVTDGDQNE